MERFKYGLLRVINVSGLTFLEPIVRLCYREEPKLQLQKIGRFIVIPVLTFAIFLGLWSVLAPILKTKSGEVPTPAVVLDAAQGIYQFHTRETDKQKAYTLEGAEREAVLASVEAELLKVRDNKVIAGDNVSAAEQVKAAEQKSLLAPVEQNLEIRQAEIAEARRVREAALQIKAEKIQAGDLSARNEFLAYLRGHQQQIEKEDDSLKALGASKAEIRDRKDLDLILALKEQTAVSEKEQYLTKKTDLLTRNNRSLKVEEELAQLKAVQKKYAQASGADLVTLGNQMLAIEQRIHKLETSDYAKPWTLPMQIVRSVACVFTGFVLATLIAIPIGILCGVSPTFMAAVTPFIALFKPVSPIVWLPISLIIVGGFITDPDKHWLMVTLSQLPLIGWLEINPAFIASAITVALCSLWPTLVNTALGVASIDKDHINVARVLRLTFTQRLFKIVIPSALPLIFAGLRISLGVGWMVLIAAELLSSSEGIGKFVWDMFNNGSSETFAQMFVVVFVVGVIGLMLDRTMIVFQRLVSFDGAPAAI
ncbi:MAG: ABC transporter permease subunit [Planctomycetaceae bacterium]|nr:ABC transporter permease subunit [Planctomycetaceae bacterium]